MPCFSEDVIFIQVPFWGIGIVIECRYLVVLEKIVLVMEIMKWLYLLRAENVD